MKKLRRLLLVGLLVASYTAAFVACEEDPTLTDEDTTQGGEDPADDENPALDSTKTALYKPVAIDSIHEYNGSKRYITLAPIYDSLMTVVGDTAVNAGSYTALVVLKDTAVYCWKDGSTDTVRVAWRIARKSLNKPTAAVTQYVDDGDGDTLVLTGFDTTLMTVTGNIATEVGDYECVVSLKDTANYMWADGTDNEVVISWRTVEKGKGKTLLKKPTCVGRWYYNSDGNNPVPAHMSDFDEATMRVSGDNMVTKGGIVLHFYVALKDTVNYAWADETVDSLAMTYFALRYMTDIWGASYSLSPTIIYDNWYSMEQEQLDPSQLSQISEKAAAIYEYIKNKTFVAKYESLEYGDMKVAAYVDYYSSVDDEVIMYDNNRLGIGTWYPEKMEDFDEMAQLVFQNLFFIEGKIHFVYTEWDNNTGEQKKFTFVFEEQGAAPQP